ncbi:MAG: hypothetical protein KKE55_00760 [Candidatus Omnitrophica bacterium]|nr:hypothetical protein [Candidatus Omnitrophota bacterium]MBU1523696.1 hypothetical protein [Candidatus Omnitrophota bacterium]MBU2436217.1 hypothetical protein [Candidatus Omnitrophota bacterium]MBU2504309.1 hypothetical protein [Candidatus Omnitrophota bacterium]
MRKIIFYFFLLGIVINFLGCANTVKGVEKDAKQNWKTLKKLDKEFQEKYW